MRVDVFGPNLPTTGEAFHVHKAGCADTKKSFYNGARRQGADLNVEYASLKAIVLDFYEPENFDYDADSEWNDYGMDFKVFACASELPAE